MDTTTEYQQQSAFMKQFPIGSPYARELAELLVQHGYSYAELDRQIRVRQAAGVDGILKGTTVQAAFARARELDEALRQAWVADQELRARRRDYAQATGRDIIDALGTTGI